MAYNHRHLLHLDCGIYSTSPFNFMLGEGLSSAFFFAGVACNSKFELPGEVIMAKQKETKIILLSLDVPVEVLAPL